VNAIGLFLNVQPDWACLPVKTDAGLTSSRHYIFPRGMMPTEIDAKPHVPDWASLRTDRSNQCQLDEDVTTLIPHSAG